VKYRSNNYRRAIQKRIFRYETKISHGLSSGSRTVRTQVKSYFQSISVWKRIVEKIEKLSSPFAPYLLSCDE